MTSRERPRQLPEYVPDQTPTDGSRSSCDGCTRPLDRRTFLGGVATVLAALALEGSVARRAFALPVRDLHRLATRDDRARHEATYPLPTADGVYIDKAEGVILARHAGEVFAFNLSCPHQNTALRWNDGNSTFQCPRHKSRYQADGTFISGRATRAMDRFALRRAGETIVVDLDSLYEQDRNLAAWTAAKVAL